MMSTHWPLRFIHLLYATFVTVAVWMQKRRRRQPNPLKTQRSKIPKHLCLNLVADNDMSTEETETAFLGCLQNVSTWCRELGIETLTVYDRQGVLYRCSEDAHRRVFPEDEALEGSGESEVEYPLTPPLSEPSGSRTHSPERLTLPVDLNIISMMHFTRLRKRRNVAVRRQPKSKGVSSAFRKLTLYIASRASGKPAVASAARSLLQNQVGGTSKSDDRVTSRSPYKLTVSKLAMVLEAGLPPPDLMIIHHIGGMKVPYPAVELHGFPPWQNTLTEFHRTHPADCQTFDSSRSKYINAPELISETAFCRALDEFSGAEFRLGR